ncbi:sialidase-like [Hippocampus comes]|uniref:sialidase-like n=1 Tax=Hippocampus comes TaxID=109280 RepID=UPI00094F04D0|nr:PREDICTED: sialidase-like [Hippocampus comes]
MADLTTGCSSSVVESPEADETTENIPPGVTPPAKRHYLDERDFPDLSLLEVTENDNTHHRTMEEISLLKNLEIMNSNSKLASFQTPRTEGKANGSQARKPETNASIFWLYNESLPDCTDYSFDSFMEQSVNFTVNVSPSDMQLLCSGAPKASVESNLARAATLDESSKPSPLAASQLSFTQSNECDASTSQDKDPSLGRGPAEQDGLPSGNTAECTTGAMGDASTISHSPDHGHHDTFEVCVKGVVETPPSQANGALSESNASDIRHNTFEAKPPCWAGGTITLSDSSSADRHHETFDAKLPSASSGTVTPPQSSLSDSHHNTFDVKPPSHCNGGKSSSWDTFDGNPPSQSTSTLSMSEKGPNNCCRDTCDAEAPRSSRETALPDTTSNGAPETNPHSQDDGTVSTPGRSSGNSCCRTLDAKPPSQSSGTFTMLESSSSHGLQNTFDAQLPKSHGTFTMSESYSSDDRPGKPSASASQLSDGHRNAFDAPRSSSDSRSNASGAARPASNGTISMSQSLSGEVCHDTFDAKPPSEPNGANVTSGSRSRDCQPNTLDPSPPPGPSSADGNADAGAVEPPQGVLDANLGEASASRAARREAKHHSTLPTHDQSLDADNNSRGFNFDDTLDLRHGNFVTSTPLTNCKMTFCASPDESKLLASSQKPDGETVGRPEVQATPDVASEICTPKIFPAAKSLPPFSKAPSLLQKFKPLTLLPRRGAVPPSGLHLPKPSLATRTLQESSAVSSSYKLRSTTTGLRPAAQQPKTGAEKPQITGGPSGIPKGPPLLRPPSTRSSVLASSADKKPSNSAVPVLQTRKRDLSRDAQLVVKKKAKTDVPAASSAIVAPRPSVDASSAVKSLRPTSKTAKDDAAVSSAARNAASRTKILKPPVKSQRTHLVKGSGCAKCVVL